MTTKPNDVNGPGGTDGLSADDVAPLEGADERAGPVFGPKQSSDTVLPPSQPEIVRVRTPVGIRGPNPFLKHFVEDGTVPDPAVRPQQGHRPTAEEVTQSLDDIDDQILEETLDQRPKDSHRVQEQTSETWEVPEHQTDSDSHNTPQFRDDEPQKHDDDAREHAIPEDEREHDTQPEPAALDDRHEPGHEPGHAPEIEEAAAPVAAAAAPELSHVPEIGPEPAAALPFVAFRSVQKTFDGKTVVVKDLNLNVAKGEFLTLLGPSGSGKTTTLMMLAGFEEPTQGQIELDGQPISHLPPHKRNIGMVFQNYALFPHMSVWDNLAFPLKVRSTPSKQVKDRVTRALQMVSLEGFEKRKPFQLSGGQQQRVAVARALVFNPTLVLMDEPLGALDRHLREQMQFEIKKLHRDLGLTIVYVTHDQSEALTLSDRIAVFYDGQIQQVDAPEVLYENPANAFVATFVGENNKLEGMVTGANQDYVTIRLDGGQTIAAVRRDCGPAGSRALVTVRPEHLHLTPEQPTQTGINSLAAHVEDVVFHGDHMRVKLSVPGGGELSVKAPGRTGGLRGDTIYVAFNVHDALAFRPME
jgi:putative spermidine/putrescine transport system ATP-binding protein